MIAALTSRPVIRRLLRHLQLAADPPPLSPAAWSHSGGEEERATVLWVPLAFRHRGRDNPTLVLYICDKAGRGLSRHPRRRAASQGRQDMQDWGVAHDKRLILRQVIVQ